MPGTACKLTASGEYGTSFETTCTVLSKVGGDDGKPTDIHLNSTEDTATQENIGWMSHYDYTDEKAVVRYLTQSSYDSAVLAGEGTFDFSAATYDETTGESTLTAFPITADGARINSVTLTGLAPDTTYCFFAGDGSDDNWSEVMTFTTKAAETETAFMVIGDTQMSGDVASDADAIGILADISSSLDGVSLDFGLQTGDFVDNGGNFSQWDEILGLFEQDFAGLNYIHVLGNHEYYGNLSGSIAESLLNPLGEDYYSVEYGNVYVAVINNDADLSEAAAWLIGDAANTDCKWKVLSVHQPPYYTNPNGGSESFNEFLPDAVDKAGIDAVFSGHDHAYARTSPMTGGKVDEQNGATYFICGDLGEKSRQSDYAIVNNPDFHFAKTSQDYSGIYLVASTSGETMTISAYDSDGVEVDSTTITKYTNQPSNSGGSTGTSTSSTVSTATTGTETAVSTTVSGTTDTTTSTTIVSISSDTANSLLNEAIAAEDSGNTVRISITAEETSEMQNVVVSIPRTSFDSMAQETNAELTIESGIGSVTLSADAMDSISNASSGDISLTISLVDTSSLSESVQELVGDRPIYDFSITAGSTNITTFGGATAQISVPYTLGAGEDPSAVVICYIDNSGNIQTIRGCYDTATGMVTGQTTHFSTYMIGYNKVTFSDVSENAWYADAVTFVAARGITTGIGNNMFGPENVLTRGQFIVMLMRAYGIEADDTLTDNFEDAGDTYYTNYLATAKQLGITTGVGENLFAPNSEITRQDMFTLLYRALNVFDELPEEALSITVNDFSDADKISDYALEAMNAFVKAGVVSGSDGALEPTGSSTRSQMAQILCNLLSA